MSRATSYPRRILRRLTGAAVDKGLGLDGPRQDYDIDRDLPVTMPDGVVLLGDRHTPKDRTAPRPVVLVRSPYGRRGLFGGLFAGPYVRHGFQVFIQSTRGTFGSGGEFRPFLTEREDGLATLEWLRAQPWCDGRVATIGLSYLGHTQWAIAPYADPPLEAVSLSVTAARITEAFYTHDGVPGLSNALDWTTTIGTQESGLLPMPGPIHSARLRKALRTVPLQAADSAIVGAPVQFWRDFTTHEPPEDEFWSPADHESADLTAMPPVTMLTGWWDLFVGSQLRDFTRLQQAGVPVRITVGPWMHGEPGEIAASTAADIEWLNHHLNGKPLADRSAVRVQLLGADDEWLDFDTWPPAGYAPNEHRLAAGGVLRSDAGAGGGDDGRAGAGVGAGAGGSAPVGESTRFTYNPSDPTPSVGGPLLSGKGKQVDNTAIEARADVLTFTSAPLSRANDVVGAPSARVFVRTSTPYADLFVRVCDVDEEGISRNVVDGIRRIHAAPSERVDPSEIVAVDLELFPTAYRFAAGHRIRVQIAGGAFPRFARNFGDGARFATATSGVPVDFEIFHDDEHPSAIALPISSESGEPL